MKKLLLLLLLCSIAYGQGWNNPKQKPWLGLKVDWTHPQSEGLVGLWLFNEGSGDKVFDLSGNGNDGTASGGYSWSAGKYGSAILLNGTDGVINCGNIINAPTVAMTLHFCAYVTDAADDDDSFFGDDGFYITWINTFSKRLRFRPYGLSSTSLDSAIGTVPRNTWITIDCVYDGAFTYIYINGILNNSQAATGTLTTGAKLFNIGTNQYTNTFGAFKYDHVILYNCALASFEIAQLYREPFCMMQGGLPVSMMYAEAPAPTGGQVIIIASMFLPVCVILSISLALVFSRKWKSNYSTMT